MAKDTVQEQKGLLSKLSQATSRWKAELLVGSALLAGAACSTTLLKQEQQPHMHASFETILAVAGYTQPTDSLGLFTELDTSPLQADPVTLADITLTQDPYFKSLYEQKAEQIAQNPWAMSAYTARLSDLSSTRDLVEGMNFEPSFIQAMLMVEGHKGSRSVSHMGAGGRPQLMASTARQYGLMVNGNVDERFDDERALHAMDRYLMDVGNNNRFSQENMLLEYISGQTSLARGEDLYRGVTPVVKNYIVEIGALELLLEQGAFTDVEQRPLLTELRRNALVVVSADKPLITLAIEHGVPYRALLRVNPAITNYRRIHPGFPIYVPKTMRSD